jgi:general secretion pathway protein J
MRGNDGAARGFTLVELLVALGVSALAATLAYAGLSTAIGASESLEAEISRLGAVQQALTIIEEDLQQVRPRAITNGFGADEAAFTGGVQPDAVLEFTRAGLANPLGLARSDLLRVRYVLDNGALWRQSWGVLDRVDDSAATDSVLLLDGIEQFNLGFLAPAQAGVQSAYYNLVANPAFWDIDWDSQRVAPDAVSPLPVAVNLTLTLSGFGEVRRVVELP